MTRDYDHRDFRKEGFRDFALALGQMNLAWNDLHLSLSGIFGQILRIQNRLVPDTLWASLKVDRAQRDMIAALLKHPALGYELSDRASTDIKWLIKKIDGIAERRNDFVHSAFVLSPKSHVVPFHGSVYQRGLNLEKVDLLDEARWFYDFTIALRNFAGQIEDALRDSHESWPEKPQLPNRGQTS